MSLDNEATTRTRLPPRPPINRSRFPATLLIIVPVRNTVLFPGVVFPITIGRPKSIAAAQQAVREQRQIGLLLQRDAELNEPGPDDLYRVGTLANIVRYITGPDDSHHIVCQGVQRIRVLDFLPGTPFLAARVLQIPEPTTSFAGDRGPLSEFAAAGHRGGGAAAAGAAGIDRRPAGDHLALDAWPTLRRPTWISSRRRSRKSSRRSTLRFAWKRFRGI